MGRGRPAGRPRLERPDDPVTPPGRPIREKGRSGRHRPGLRATEGCARFGLGIEENGNAATMAIKLHRCSDLSAKSEDHPCWRVQRELDAFGIEYELVEGPVAQDEREALLHLSGQKLYPVLEFEDGRVYREDTEEMVDRI